MSNKEYPRNWATILSRMSISDIHIEDCQRYAEMQVYLTFLSLTKWELLVVIEMFRDLFEKSSTQLQEATKIENFRGQQRSMAIKALFQENKKLKARIQELESANIRSDNPRHQQALNHSITPTRRNSTSVGNQFMRGSYETPQFNRSRELTNPGSARSRRSSTTPNRITLARSPADGTLIKRRGKSPMHDKEPQNERTKYRGDFRTPLMTGSRNDLETPSQGRTQGISASRPGRQIIMMSRQIRHSK
eukprot:m.266280 g.266280  ORF g.266280 m.266280 type:complete len:248 (+) comp16239_c0_seq20:349-1092(+)